MNPTTIIAEAGVNHNGDISLAKKMIDVAAVAGVDYIKFQTFKAESLVSKSAKMAEYQQINLPSDNDSQFEMLKKLELKESDYQELMEYCEVRGVKFLSTPFDIDSVKFLDSIGVNVFKVPSGEITNYPYLREIGTRGKPIILSTGMCRLGEIEDAIHVLISAGASRKDVCVLHCNTEYPTPMRDVNLRAMLTIKEAFGLNVGYSDHTLGIEVPTAAVALGATVIEKHFTLDRNLPGPDHKASLEPDELVAMVKAIRNIEQALGDGLKYPSKSEVKNLTVARKSIVASIPIKKGDRFGIKNLTTKRPGSGISPMRWDEVVGKIAKKDFSEDELIEI